MSESITHIAADPNANGGQACRRCGLLLMEDESESAMTLTAFFPPGSPVVEKDGYFSVAPRSIWTDAELGDVRDCV